MLARIAGFLLVLSLLWPSSCSRAYKTPNEQNVFTNKSGAAFQFEWKEGMIIVPVSIRGSRPLRFVLDSGSTRMLLDRAVAASLGFREGETSSLQGAGQGRIPIRALHDVDLQFPGLDSNGYDFFTIDLAPEERTLGTREDGILGYDFFSRFVVTIDFEARRVTVQPPAAFRPRSGSEELPLAIRGKWPFVKGELVLPGPVTVQDSFLVDSGSSDGVDHPAVKTMQDKTATSSGIGLGSPVNGVVGVASSFRIGSFTLSSPIVSCCGATEETSRIIGTGILKHFVVTFDYPSSHFFWYLPAR